MTVTKEHMLELVSKNVEMTPKEIVSSYHMEAFEEVADILWQLVDTGVLEVAQNKTLRVTSE